VPKRCLIVSDRYEQYVKISSTDGKNVVESVLNDLQKQADKGRVEFGLDIEIERVSDIRIPDTDGTEFE